MSSMVDTAMPALGGVVDSRGHVQEATSFTCRHAASEAQAIILSALTRLDPPPTVLAASVCGSGTTWLHMALADVADLLARVLGEVGFVLTALPSGGRP